MLFKKRQHAVIEQIRSHHRVLAIIELGKGHLAVGIDEGLLVAPGRPPLAFRHKRYHGPRNIPDIRFQTIRPINQREPKD